MDNVQAQTGFLSPKLTPDLLRCLASVVSGKTVEVWGGQPEECRAALAGATSIQKFKVLRTRKGSKSGADVVLCLDPKHVDQFLQLPELRSRLSQGGVVIAAWSGEPYPQPAPAVQYVAHYSCRALTGAIIGDVEFAQSRVVALRDGTAGWNPDLHLWLWSDRPLPTPRLGLYEAGIVAAGSDAPAVSIVSTPDAATNRRQREDARAIALTRRLLAVEDRTIALRMDNYRLKARLSERDAPAQQGYFDVPRTRQDWALAEAPTRPPATLGLYERRPDDSVILEAQRGEAFMRIHDLLTEPPNFKGAVDALNLSERRIKIDADHPQVSIIIPVYGQLPYTLNCLDSLFGHTSRFSVEIIVLDDCSPDQITEEFVPQVKDVRYHRQPKNGGFISSCNKGGELARGDFVLLLNSDTRVVDGWLDEMIDSFRIFPKAGLVGSKMLYADGMLQEAGGILWRDGSAWNYGREDDPNRPQYCYARQVDYISGCSIALPMALWRSLGGFDSHYTPAYAEDADICQRVAALGLEVWYQPMSRVVHYEGKTSGTSTTGGAKAYQVINLKKLFLRHRSQFETHRRNAEAPFFEKERGVRKRILFIDAVTPTPNQDAGSAQTVMVLRCSRDSGYKTHFVPEDNWLYEPKYTPGLQREGVECFYAPFDVGLESYIRRYGWLFDIIFVFRVGIMHKCLPLLREFAPNALLIFHVADLHYLRMQRQAELTNDAAAMRLANDLKITELETIRLSDCTITHSTVEAEILAAELPDAPVTVWPLMVDLAGTNVPFEKRRDICFLGGYRHPPNVDAVFYFLREVLPLIWAVRPEIRFIIAGANPTLDLLDLASDRVIITGMIENLADVFDATRVFVCPLRVGAGAKGKVMSALSHGLPIVSTGIGIEGAGLTEGVHVLVADDPVAMAEAILRVYDDEDLWRALSLAGLDLLRENFSPEMGVRQFAEAVDKAYRHRLGLTAV
jgi:GT2 family glycosyltransferase